MDSCDSNGSYSYSYNRLVLCGNADKLNMTVQLVVCIR